MMKIATVITRLNMGGVSPMVISLAAGFQNRGHNSVLIVGVSQLLEGSIEADAAKAEYLGSEGRKLVSTLDQQERMVDETLCCFKQLLAEARMNGARSPKDN